METLTGTKQSIRGSSAFLLLCYSPALGQVPSGSLLKACLMGKKYLCELIGKNDLNTKCENNMKTEKSKTTLK